MQLKLLTMIKKYTINTKLENILCILLKGISRKDTYFIQKYANNKTEYESKTRRKQVSIFTNRYTIIRLTFLVRQNAIYRMQVRYKYIIKRKREYLLKCMQKKTNSWKDKGNKIGKEIHIDI